jgi:hypothetical protein
LRELNDGICDPCYEDLAESAAPGEQAATLEEYLEELEDGTPEEKKKKHAETISKHADSITALHAMFKTGAAFLARLTEMGLNTDGLLEEGEDPETIAAEVSAGANCVCTANCGHVCTQHSCVYTRHSLCIHNTLVVYTRHSCCVYTTSAVCVYTYLRHVYMSDRCVYTCVNVYTQFTSCVYTFT